MKRYGFIPESKVNAENLSSSFNQGLDAGLILDTLANRIKDLERRVLDTESSGNENEDVNVSIRRLKKSYGDSPLRESIRSNMRIPAPAARKESVDSEGLSVLAYQIEECQKDIRHLYDKLRQQEITAAVSASRDSDPLDSRADEKRRNRQAPSGTEALLEEEIKAIKKKVKKLAESTSKACRSLSSGMSDVQQATLNLYSWADKAHDSIGIVSDRLGLAVNLCPRAKIYNPANKSESQILNYNEL